VKHPSTEIQNIILFLKGQHMIVVKDTNTRNK